MKPKKVENVVEASKYLSFLKKIFGVSVFTIEKTLDDKIKSKFSPYGFVFFLAWFIFYYYSLYKVISEDQTILRKLLNTRLKHYGDQVEVLVTSVLVMYATWKAPFDLGGNIKCMECIVNIDKELKLLGEHIDYEKNIKRSLILPIGQILITFSRIISIYALKLDTTIRFTKVYQVVYSDFIAFFLMTQFCHFLYELRVRYEIMNKILEDITKNKSKEYLIFRVHKQVLNSNSVRIQDKNLCEKLRACGNIYGMLHKTAMLVNDQFGVSLVIKMLVCLFLIVLYLYYFMEATASGLFHDPNRYINFVVYVSWVICYAFIVIFFSIYFSENAIKQAKITPNKAHEIINSDLDISITREAAHLSVQVLHQTPEFSGCGLTKLNYELILEGTRSVVTFLVIMLQFLTDNNHTN